MPKQKSNAPAASGGGPTLTTPLKGLSAQVVSQPQQPKPLPKQVSMPSPSAYAKMMADPLHSEAVGKPDESGYRTNASKIRDVYDITANANGEAVLVVGAAVTGVVWNAPTITASAVTALGTAALSSWYTTLSNDNDLYRPLVAAVEWHPSMSGNLSSGMVFMGQYMASTLADFPLQALSAYFDDEGVFASASTDMVSVMRPVQNRSMGALTNNFLDQFPVVAVVFTGLPAGVAGKVVVTRCLELVPKGGTMPAMTAKNTPCDMHACCIAANVQGSPVMYQAGPGAYDKIKSIGIKLLKDVTMKYLNYATGGAAGLAATLL